MEKETAPRQHQPRTANDRSRLIITTLLLLGGAFVLCLTWTIRYYHIFIDRVTPYVPESAEVVITIPFDEGLSSVLGSFKGEFGQALTSIRFVKGDTLVIFVDRDVDNGDPSWQIMTDATIDNDAVPDTLFSSSYHSLNLISPNKPWIRGGTEVIKSHIFLIRRGSGKGFVSEKFATRFLSSGNSIRDSHLPIRLLFLEDRFKLQVGKRLRGIMTPHEFPVNSRQISFLPSTTSAYALIPPGKFSWAQEGFNLETPLNKVVKNSGVISEILLNQDGHFAALLHQANEGHPRIEVIEQPLIDELRTLQPTEHIVILPDGSLMTELREHLGEVKLTERTVLGDMTLRTHTSEDGREFSLILYPDGHMWITDDMTLVGSLILSSSNWEERDDACQPTTSSPGLVFTTTHVKDIPSMMKPITSFLSNFKVNTLRIDDTETGLYTFCGYF